MPNLRFFSSPEKITAKYEKDLKKAIASNNQDKITSIFSKAFMFLLKKKRAEGLSDLILVYCPEIDEFSKLEVQISSLQLRKGVAFLENNKCDSAALLICEKAGYDAKTIEILVRQGRANTLMMQITKENSVDQSLLNTMIISWEKYHGDIRKSPSLCNALINVSKFSPESIPAHPEAKEIIGQFEEAAELFVQKDKLFDAANCYEKAQMYNEASRLYEAIENYEQASQAAELAGDFEKALHLVVKPERKLKLLMQTDRYLEAREFAMGLESANEHLDQIKKLAQKRVTIKSKGHDFLGAIELSDVAECSISEKESILELGRQHYDSKIATAVSQEELNNIY